MTAASRRRRAPWGHTLTCLALCTAVLFASACGGIADDTSNLPGVIVRDSAGVEIVESDLPAWSEGDGWTLEAEPFLQIGAREGAEGELLSQVVGLAVLPGGGFVVANGGDNTLRYFDSEGRFVRRVGGTGDGPREFTDLRGVVVRGGEVWGLQSTGSQKVFDRRGEFIRSVAPGSFVDATAAYRVSQVSGVFDDGSLLLTLYVPSSPAAGETSLDTLVVSRWVTGAEVDTLMQIPSSRSVGRSDGGRSRQEFGPRSLLFAAPEALYWSWSEDAEVTVFDMDGQPRSIWRWAPGRLPVTEAQQQAYRDEYVGVTRGEGGLAITNPLQEQRRRIAEAMIFPGYHNVSVSLLVDEEGRAWLMQNPAPAGGGDRPGGTSWSVLDSTGVWLGPVSMPPRFSPRVITREYVAGIWTDELDVQYIRFYRIE